MSLMHLLTRGQSFSGLKPRGGAYKLREGRLPKFASAKRQLSLVPAPERAREIRQVAAVEQKQSAPGVASHGKPIAVPGAGRDQNPANMNNPLTQAKMKWSAKIISVVAENVRAITSTIAGMFSSGRSRRKAADSAVQPELQLEKVRPLRNDLNESDLEVVEQKLNLSMSKRELARAGWTRQTIRFINPKTGYEVEKEIAVQKNPDVVEVATASDVAAFIEKESEREKTPELFAQV